MDVSLPTNNETILENIVCDNNRVIVWKIQRSLLDKILTDIDIFNMDQNLLAQNIIKELFYIIRDKIFIFKLSNILQAVKIENITGLYKKLLQNFQPEIKILFYIIQY